MQDLRLGGVFFEGIFEVRLWRWNMFWGGRERRIIETMRFMSEWVSELNECFWFGDLTGFEERRGLLIRIHCELGFDHVRLFLNVYFGVDLAPSNIKLYHELTSLSLSLESLCVFARNLYIFVVVSRSRRVYCTTKTSNGFSRHVQMDVTTSYVVKSSPDVATNLLLISSFFSISHESSISSPWSPS